MHALPISVAFLLRPPGCRGGRPELACVKCRGDVGTGGFTQFVKVLVLHVNSR